MRQLALLANRNETAAEPICYRAAKYEPARLNASHGIDRLRPVWFGEPRNGCLKTLCIGKQRRDVTKHDAWFRDNPESFGLGFSSCPLVHPSVMTNSGRQNSNNSSSHCRDWGTRIHRADGFRSTDMAEPRFSMTADEDLPRTLRREKEAREREARERDDASSGAAPGVAPVNTTMVSEARYEPDTVTVSYLQIPFLHLMLFFIKAVFRSHTGPYSAGYRCLSDRRDTAIVHPMDATVRDRNPPADRMIYRDAALRRDRHVAGSIVMVTERGRPRHPVLQRACGSRASGAVIRCNVQRPIRTDRTRRMLTRK